MALLTAIILVSLATVLAVSIAFGTAMTARRSASSFTVEQGLLFGAAAENLAAYALQEDMRSNTGGSSNPPPAIDMPGDAWTTPYGPVEIADDVALEALLKDESGKFNLNSLVGARGQAQQQPIDETSMEILTRLLDILGLESRWAPLIADFIDQDGNAGTNGGEDNLYTREQPPYRAANGWITSPSELLALPGFGRERYLRLLPHVTALPPEERAINVCFASPELLDAIGSVYTQSAANEYVNARNGDTAGFEQIRKGSCFPRKTVFIETKSALPATKKQSLDAKLAEQSQYFRLHTWVTIGTTRFALYSLLRRQGPNVTLVSRSFGTE